MSAQAIENAAGRVTFAAALVFWLKLGFISFGGPAGQIAIMHEELVERRRWISERRFLHALNYCMLLPGPEAQQLATYIGWLMHRTWGGIVAGGLFVLPSLFILIALSWIYMALRRRARRGRACSTASSRRSPRSCCTRRAASARARCKNGGLWAIAVAAFVAIFAFDVPFPLIVLAAGLVGLSRRTLSPRGAFSRASRTRRRRRQHARCADRRRHAHASARALSRGHASCACSRSCVALWAAAIGGLMRRLRLERRPDADGLVLHQGGAAHLRRRVCGAALRRTRARSSTTSG